LGYLGWNDDYFIKSLSLAELYIILREILKHGCVLYAEGSLIKLLLNMLKLKRFRSTIKEAVLPQFW